MRNHALLVLLTLGAVCTYAADPPKPLPFENEIKAFEAADARQMPPRDAILFYGSSSIRLWKTLAQDFPDKTVINRGFGGSQTSDAIRYEPRVVAPYHPKQIVIYEGDNDLAAGKSPQQVAADFQRFVEITRKDLPQVRIDFISIKPCIARLKLIDQVREANRLVQEYAAKTPGVGYINIFDAMLGPDGKPRADLLQKDGLHCSPAGYAIWVKIVRDHLK